MERMAYEQNLYAYRDIKNGLDSAWRIGFEEGFAKGFAKGFAEEEFKTKKRAARMMKAKGFDVSLISELTGLSEDQIAEL